MREENYNQHPPIKIKWYLKTAIYLTHLCWIVIVLLYEYQRIEEYGFELQKFFKFLALLALGLLMPVRIALLGTKYQELLFPKSKV